MSSSRQIELGGLMKESVKSCEISLVKAARLLSDRQSLQMVAEQK